MRCVIENGPVMRSSSFVHVVQKATGKLVIKEMMGARQRPGGTMFKKAFLRIMNRKMNHLRVQRLVHEKHS